MVDRATAVANARGRFYREFSGPAFATRQIWVPALDQILVAVASGIDGQTCRYFGEAPALDPARRLCYARSPLRNIAGETVGESCQPLATADILEDHR